MSLRERLLETPVEKVPPEMAAAVKAFCEPIPEVRTAYVGLVEVTRDFDFPEEKLAVAFELVAPPTDASHDPAVRRIALRFYEEVPASISDGGCNFLGVDALPAWNEKAWQVFSR
jgi:hypothetical protein